MIKILGVEDPNDKNTWICAVSTNLEVSGMGSSRKDALEALRRSMRSILRLNNKLKEKKV